jgi:hypothetical protein
MRLFATRARLLIDEIYFKEVSAHLRNNKMTHSTSRKKTRTTCLLRILDIDVVFKKGSNVLL